MLRHSDGEKKLRQHIEKERLRTYPLSGALQIAEVDVRGEILLPRIRKKVAMHALSRVRRGRAEPACARMKQLLRRISVIERDDQPARDEPRHVFMKCLPLRRHIRKL